MQSTGSPSRMSDSQSTPARRACASAGSRAARARASCSVSWCWWRASPSRLLMRGRTVTNVTSAPTSAASSTPSSTAAQEPSDPSVAITIRCMVYSFLKTDSPSGRIAGHVAKAERRSGICRRRFRGQTDDSSADQSPHWPDAHVGIPDIRDVILGPGETLRLRLPIAQLADDVTALVELDLNPVFALPDQGTR